MGGGREGDKKETGEKDEADRHVGRGRERNTEGERGERGEKEKNKI